MATHVYYPNIEAEEEVHELKASVDFKPRACLKAT